MSNFDLFNIMCEKHNSSALNPFLNGTKNGEKMNKEHENKSELWSRIWTTYKCIRLSLLPWLVLWLVLQEETMNKEHCQTLCVKCQLLLFGHWIQTRRFFTIYFNIDTSIEATLSAVFTQFIFYPGPCVTFSKSSLSPITPLQVISRNFFTGILNFAGFCVESHKKSSQKIKMCILTASVCVWVLTLSNLLNYNSANLPNLLILNW